jgi:hypothetical protein
MEVEIMKVQFKPASERIISATSREAFQNGAQSSEARINALMRYLDETPQGATADEMAEHFGWVHQTVSALLSKAEANAKVCRDGSRRET